MRHAEPRGSRLRHRIGRAFAVLALIVQTGAWIHAVANATILASDAICRASTQSDPPVDGSSRHMTDCALCPLCFCMASGATLLPVVASLPEPTGAGFRLAVQRPPPTGPPSWPRRTAQPRAPPPTA